NRYVRPLLRALTGSMAGALSARFFGRDWIAVGHRPAAWVGFAHDATTRRTLFEAFVAVRAPFATGDRASFRGRPPGTLESIAAATFDPERVARAVADAYARGADAAVMDAPAPLVEDADAEDVRGDPPWAATRDEAIGIVGAGPDARGRLRVGGDLLVSRDALARLESRAAAAGAAELGRVVDETLGAPGVALDGVRSLDSIRDVIARARG
ncbi:MAG TPA: hypothetical protein VE987_07340, partial [Polyangiaceae bacterium]|nr:hypothetical protein [Polyangiaceae bacterium]